MDRGADHSSEVKTGKGDGYYDGVYLIAKALLDEEWEETCDVKIKGTTCQHAGEDAIGHAVFGVGC